MKLKFAFLFLFIFTTAIFNNAFAKYNNPLLKVLLFQTSKPVILTDSYGLKAKGVKLLSSESRKLTIYPVNSNKVRINNRLYHKGSLFISSKRYIQVQKKGSKSIRRYSGKIEIKPYKNGFYVINHVHTENYLEGVLNAEISTKWNMEVVKAQSILARTFALFKRNARKNYQWHLKSDHSDQVYLGVNIADARGKYAIKATNGLVVSYRGKLAQTFYHSNCGGMTEDPGNLWQYSLPYLRIMAVPYGQDDPKYNWEVNFNNWEINKILKKGNIYIKNLNEIFISERTSSNRVFEMVFQGNKQNYLLASDFRKYAGYKKVQSLLFEVIKTPNGFKFKGKGNGHGVGMCQWAAKEMAEEGFNYKDILNYFYSPIIIKKYNG